MKKVRLIISSLFTLICFPLFSQLVINEVQYENKITLFDQHGKTPDWIELFNSGDSPLNLSAYKLSDDSELEDVWQMPELLIEAKSFVLIYASGKDTIEGEEVHADFKLSLMNDPLYLLDSAGVVIDEIPVQCVPVDKSIGRFSDGDSQLAILEPTPASSNNNASQFIIDYQPDSLIASHQSGIYPDAIKLELKHLHPENVIYYTLNGNDPEDGDLYSEPLLFDDISSGENRFAGKCDGDYKPGNMLSKANVLRAQVYSAGCPASNEVAASFFINKNNKFDYDIPVASLISPAKGYFDDEEGIYVEGDNENYNQRGSEWERKTHLEVFDADKRLVVDQNVGIRIHGRGSRSMPQKSLRVYAKEKYGKATLDYKFFPQRDYTSFQKLLISAEKTLSPVVFKDELCAQMVRELDVDYQAWQAVVVFLNGEYWGIHHFREYQNEEYFKHLHHIDADSIDVVTYDHSGPLGSSATAMSVYDELLAFVLNNNMRNDANFEQLEEMVDVDNMIDFYIAQLYFANYDFPDNNYRMWKPRVEGAKWRWLFYDCEAGMYMSESDNYLDYVKAPHEMLNVPDWSVSIMRELMCNEKFKNWFSYRFQAYLTSVFSTENVLQTIDEFRKTYTPLISEHIYRWNSPSTLEKWKQNIDAVEMFALRRPTYLHNELQKVFAKPFVVYPKPVKTYFHVDFFEEGESRSCWLFDMHGQMLINQDLSENNTIEINRSLKRGLYFLRIKNGQFYYTETIAVE